MRALLINQKVRDVSVTSALNVRRRKQFLNLVSTQIDDRDFFEIRLDDYDNYRKRANSRTEETKALEEDNKK